MLNFIIMHEVQIRVGVFAGIFAAIALWELIAPRRVLQVSKIVRWANNLGIVVINTIILRLLFPTAAVGAAIFAASYNFGIFNFVLWPVWIEALFSLIVLDLLIYVQHVMFHAFPALWRVHRIHHADVDFDVSTGVRFHPIEILASMMIKMAAIGVLGAAPLVVIIFEVLLNGTSMFNHGNIKLPQLVDKWVRFVLVTPDMHRVHHSVIAEETDRNFGFNLSCWDRIFGTYKAQPDAGHRNMAVGLEQFREPRMQSLWKLVLMPILNENEVSSKIHRKEK
tara:strand:+ start:656 stop:1495 length:840 start_codon:yes stop_codon:yes gene_type:complete